MSKSIFVPGRVCMLGEHTDWAANYRDRNARVPEGRCIVYGTSVGLHATVRPHHPTAEGSAPRLRYRTVGRPESAPAHFDIELEERSLKAHAAEGGFYSYVAGTAAIIVGRFGALSHHPSLEIDVHTVDLPTKKGLSSSAACCVLVARAFNELWNLGLDTSAIMDVAYHGELETPSRCGRMDQCCAYGQTGVLMTFTGRSGIRADPLRCGADFHFVVADLKAGKDTKRILADLNAAYPEPTTEPARDVHTFLGELSNQHVERAAAALTAGDPQALGAAMAAAQEDFARLMVAQCPMELRSPKLYSILADERVKLNSLGGKGVGSQGDGSIQFVCADAAQQEALCRLLEADFGCAPLKFTLPKWIEA